ncbi:MAG: hypothetical protein WC309_01460 [Candidatus Paceibacterota bacterium]|jgi:hypothetical protein
MFEFQFEDDFIPELLNRFSRKREVTEEEMEESEKQTKKTIKNFPKGIGDIILVIPIGMN